MKETVLLYNFNNKERLLAIRQALMPLGFRIRMVEKEDYGKPLGMLAGVKGMEEAMETVESGESGESVRPDSGQALASEAGVVGADGGFDDEMAVLAGLTSAQVDAFIKALRKKGVGRIDYKAILTPVNKYWDSVYLYHEIKKEHETMTGR